MLLVEKYRRHAAWRRRMPPPTLFNRREAHTDAGRDWAHRYGATVVEAREMIFTSGLIFCAQKCNHRKAKCATVRSPKSSNFGGLGLANMRIISSHQYNARHRHMGCCRLRAHELTKYHGL